MIRYLIETLFVCFALLGLYVFVIASLDAWTYYQTVVRKHRF